MQRDRNRDRYVAAHDPDAGWAVVDRQLGRTVSEYTPNKAIAAALAEAKNAQADE